MTREEVIATAFLIALGWRYRLVGNVTPPGSFHARWTHPFLPGQELVYNPAEKAPL